MAIERMAIVGKGAVGLLYGSIAAAHLDAGAVTYVMDDARFERHDTTGRSSMACNAISKLCP